MRYRLLGRSGWWLPALALLAVPAGAEDGPTASATAEAVTVGIAGQSAVASLADGRLTVRGPSGERHWHVSILNGKGWTAPARAARRPVVRSTRDEAHVRVAYPVEGEREFVLELAAYRGIPALFVTGRLARLKDAGSEYYYWSSDVTFDRYTTPGEKGPEDAAADQGKWESLPWREWLYLPQAKAGLALLPTNVSGRTPGEMGTLFLHAVPRSGLVEPGDPLVSSFALAEVGGAQEAAALSKASRARGVPTPQAPGAARREWGKPAPDWLRRAEVYNLYYRPAAQWSEEVVRDRLRGLPLIVGSTPDKAALEKCHKAGVRLLHYVVYTCLLDTAMQTREGGKVYSEWSESIDCETRDLAKHPDWVCYDAEGKIQKDGWGQAHGHPGLLNTCLHQPGLKEAAVRQVRLLMERGYDGVFIDLSGPTVECYGPKFGKHTHPDPAKTNTQAYAEVLAAVYRTVKGFGAERIVMQNTCTGTLPSHWSTCDAQMLEAYPFGEESGDLRASWPELQWAGARSLEAVRQGKAPVILPYFGKLAPERATEAALFSAAYARLYGFLWADAYTLLDGKEGAPLAKQLYSLRLGRPKGEPAGSGAVTYRLFERGLAAVNPTKQPAVVSLPASGKGSFQDVGYGRRTVPEGGRVRLEIAPEAGRILVR